MFIYNLLFKNTRVFIIWLVFILAISYAVKFNNTSSNTKDFTPIEKISKGVAIQYSDKTTGYIDLPYTIKSSKPFNLYIDLKYFGALHRKSIGLYTEGMDFDLSIKDDSFFFYKTPKNSITYMGGSAAFMIVDLPFDIKDPVLRIKFTPIAKSSYYKYTLHPIYVGNRVNFFLTLLKDDAISLAMTTILFILSIISFMFSSISKIQGQLDDRRIYDVGLIAFVISIYSYSKMSSVIYLLSNYRMLVHFAEYISLMLLTYPMLRFIKGRLDPKYNITIILGYIVIVLNLALQLFVVLSKTYDFQELIPYTHMVLFITFFIFIGIIVLSDKKMYPEKNNFVISAIPICISFAIAMVLYYFTRKKFISFVTLAPVFIFILMQVKYIIDFYLKVRETAKKSEIYDKMAHIDALTNLKNRLSFEKKLNELRKFPVKCCVVSIDLNDLKTINDTLGHSYGDKAIITMGNFLVEQFGKDNVYRLGGDEYAVITDELMYDDRLKELKSIKIKFDSGKMTIFLNFAIGYKNFYPSSNIGIDEALKISDELMYQDKKAYKEKYNLKRY